MIGVGGQLGPSPDLDEYGGVPSQRRYCRGLHLRIWWGRVQVRRRRGGGKRGQMRRKMVTRGVVASVIFLGAQSATVAKVKKDTTCQRRLYGREGVGSKILEGGDSYTSE